MLVYRCDRCYAILDESKTFYGVTFYEYTPSSDKASKLYHLCKKCFLELKNTLNANINFKVVKYLDEMD